MANVSYPPDRLIDDKTLAERWDWNPGTPGVLRARQTMPIPFLKIGKSIRYRLSDVIDYESRQTVGASPRK